MWRHTTLGWQRTAGAGPPAQTIERRLFLSRLPPGQGVHLAAPVAAAMARLHPLFDEIEAYEDEPVSCDILWQRVQRRADLLAELAALATTPPFRAGAERLITGDDALEQALATALAAS